MSSLTCNSSVANVLSYIKRKLCGWPLLCFLLSRIEFPVPNDLVSLHEGCLQLLRVAQYVRRSCASVANIDYSRYRWQSIFH